MLFPVRSWYTQICSLITFLAAWTLCSRCRNQFAHLSVLMLIWPLRNVSCQGWMARGACSSHFSGVLFSWWVSGNRTGAGLLRTYQEQRSFAQICWWVTRHHSRYYSTNLALQYLLQVFSIWFFIGSRSFPSIRTPYKSYTGKPRSWFIVLSAWPRSLWRNGG